MDRDNSSDRDLIAMLRNGNGSERDKAFEVIYLRHKRYNINFMRSRFKQLEGLEDLYHEAVLVLCESVKRPDWQLKCKIQTFLNTVSFHQGLTELGRPTQPLGPEDDVEDISDRPPQIEESPNEEIDQIIGDILNDRSKTSKSCRDMLTRRLFYKQSYKIISEEMGYKNERTAITQGHRCMKKLRKEVNKRRGGNNA